MSCAAGRRTLVRCAQSTASCRAHGTASDPSDACYAVLRDEHRSSGASLPGTALEARPEESVEQGTQLAKSAAWSSAVRSHLGQQLAPPSTRPAASVRWPRWSAAGTLGSQPARQYSLLAQQLRYDPHRVDPNFRIPRDVVSARDAPRQGRDSRNRREQQRPSTAAHQGGRGAGQRSTSARGNRAERKPDAAPATQLSAPIPAGARVATPSPSAAAVTAKTIAAIQETAGMPHMPHHRPSRIHDV